MNDIVNHFTSVLGSPSKTEKSERLGKKYKGLGVDLLWKCRHCGGLSISKAPVKGSSWDLTLIRSMPSSVDLSKALSSGSKYSDVFSGSFNDAALLDWIENNSSVVIDVLSGK